MAADDTFNVPMARVDCHHSAKSEKMRVGPVSLISHTRCGITCPNLHGSYYTSSREPGTS